jgi:peroxiredoxin-like protein
MNEVHEYEVNLKWDQDRKGTLSSPVLTELIEVATPPEFPGGMPNIWSPEHLLVAAVSSCMMTTFLAVAENFKLSYQHFSCRAVGKLEKVDGKYMVSEIVLYPVVSINFEEDREKTERVLMKSEAACLISNSVKSKVMMNPSINLL